MILENSFLFEEIESLKIRFSDSSLPLGCAWDFDKTMINEDSFYILVKESLKDQPLKAFLLGFLFPFVIFFLLVLYLILGRLAAKSGILWLVTVGHPKRRIPGLIHKWCKPCQSLFYRDFMNILPLLKDLHVLVITGSGHFWVRNILKSKGIPFNQVIGTSMKFFMGGVVFVGPQCVGPEKVVRLKNKNHYKWIMAFSDHSADIPLLQIAVNKYFINPKLRCLYHVRNFYSKISPSPVSLLFWKKL